MADDDSSTLNDHEFNAGEQDNTSGKGSASMLWDNVLKSMPGMAAQVFTRASGQSKNLLEIALKAPEYLEQLGKAGQKLKDLREVSKLTVEDLARAINLENPEILRGVEEGRSPVTLDILLRLASFYSRNDPISFVISFSKEYVPWLWYILRVSGMEKLLITLEKEQKFINILRSRDAARELSDQDFDKLLGFTRQSFDMALDFIAPVAAKSTPETEVDPQPTSPDNSAE